MNDKELLQKIKNIRTAVKEIYGNVNTITYPIYMVDWLIEQAEKIQRCQESYSGLNKMYDHWRNKAKELEKQLQQTQNTIKEALETLKSGGPGTRSQIQQLLEKALEEGEV
jgi:uncharacterized phage infection (PIP) family protein YhgE